MSIRAGQLFAAICCLLAALPAADLPLGAVVAVDGDRVIVGFDQATGLEPDGMVAIYGPGSVEKHPLEDTVIIERRALAAKMQVLASLGGDRFEGRLTWTAPEAAVAAGFDAVPMPDEASPDAPPVLTEALPVVTAPAQGRVRISLPIVDPEGRGLSCSWWLEGDPGAVGRLQARVTSQPQVEWLAPTERLEGAQLGVRAIDGSGLTQEWRVPLQVSPLGDEWRQRRLLAHAVVGVDGAWQRLTRDPRGGLLAIEGRQLVHIRPGWSGSDAVPVQEDLSISAPRAVVPRGDELFVLDAGQRAVLVLARDGVLRRRIGQLRQPVDLAVRPDGVCLVADTDLGGVLVYEASGMLRCRLGRPGEGADAFQELAAIALDPAGGLYVLDRRALRIHHFDHHFRRGPVLTVPVPEDQQPVDCAVGPLGLMVLLNDGRILIYNEHGDATRALPPATDSGLVERLTAPATLSVDGDGSLLVAYPDDQLIARYDAAGAFVGLRGQPLWQLDQFVVDGAGVTYGLDLRGLAVSVFDPQGWLVRRLGGSTRDGGPFERCQALAVDPSGRWLCVLDSSRRCVVRYDLQKPDNRPLVFGQPGDGPGQFDRPIQLAMDDRDHVYVLDYDLHRISVFRCSDGALRFTFGKYERGREDHEIQRPAFIAVEPRGTVAYVYDSRRYQIMKFALDHDGKAAGHVANGGGRGDAPGQFAAVIGLGCDRLGLLYVLDESNRNLQVIDFRQSNPVAIHTLAGDTLHTRSPRSLALGPDGHPWIGDGERLIGFHWR